MKDRDFPPNRGSFWGDADYHGLALVPEEQAEALANEALDMERTEAELITAASTQEFCLEQLKDTYRRLRG